MSLVSKVIVNGSECEKVEYVGITYNFKQSENFEISNVDYLPEYNRIEKEYCPTAYFYPCHFGIFIGNGCYYVTTPQCCKRFYNIYATPEDRITQNNTDGYIEFSKFYDKFYSSTDNPELMYHYDSTHKIFYIIKKVYLMHNPDKNSGQGGHKNSYHWYWPQFYVMSVPREIEGNIVCFGQQYNEGCLDASNNQIVFDKIITKKKFETASATYIKVDISAKEVPITLPNNDFIKCYTDSNPQVDPSDISGLNTYGTFSDFRKEKLSIFEKETISISEMSQKYYFLMIDAFKPYYDNQTNLQKEAAGKVEIVIIEMEIVQNTTVDLAPWGLDNVNVEYLPGVSNFVWTSSENVFGYVKSYGVGEIPFFKKSDTNGYVYNFVTKIGPVYIACAEWDNYPWDLDFMNINGPLTRQSAEPAREGDMYTFELYSGPEKSIHIPSLSYLIDHSSGVEGFHNHEFSVLRSNLFVN